MCHFLLLIFFSSNDCWSLCMTAHTYFQITGNTYNFTITKNSHIFFLSLQVTSTNKQLLYWSTKNKKSPNLVAHTVIIIKDISSHWKEIKIKWQQIGIIVSLLLNLLQLPYLYGLDVVQLYHQIVGHQPRYSLILGK